MSSEQEKAEKPDPLTIPNRRFEKFTGLTVAENKDFSKIYDEISKRILALIEIIEKMDTQNPRIEKLIANLLDAVFVEQEELDKYLDKQDFKNALISSKKYLALLDMIIGDESAILLQTLVKSLTLQHMINAFRSKTSE